MTQQEQLLDAITRHQVYLEGVKNQQVRLFYPVLFALRDDLRRLFEVLEYKSFDTVTQQRLEMLISQLRTAQTRSYDTFTQQLLTSLREFVEVDYTINTAIADNVDIAERRPESTVLPSTITLWTSVSTLYVGATGANVYEFVQQAKIASLNAVVTALRAAYAQKRTVADFAASLKGQGGVESRLLNWANTLVSTLFQHSASVVNDAIMGAYFSRYVWAAVLDKRTSKICRSRNGSVYRYGEGPLPPAHVNCRSRIIPVVSESVAIPPDFYSWLIRQPTRVQDDILGRKQAQALRAGRLSPEKLRRFDEQKPLTIQGLLTKLDLITMT